MQNLRHESRELIDHREESENGQTVADDDGPDSRGAEQLAPGHVTGTLLGGGGADGLLDLSPLLGSDARMGGGGLVDEGEPGQGPEQTHGSRQVEDTGPASNGDEIAADRHGNGSTQRGSCRVRNKISN